MSNIKTTFDSFLNEELKSSTYRSAAEKIRDKGFPKRSDKLHDYADDLELKTSFTHDDEVIYIKEKQVQFTPTGMVNINNYDNFKMQITFDNFDKHIKIVGAKLDTRKAAVILYKFLKDVYNVTKKPSITEYYDDFFKSLSVNDLYKEVE